MIKATIKRGEVKMECTGTPLTLIGEASMLIESLIADICEGAPDKKMCESIIWDMFLTVMKQRHQ